MFPEWFTLAKAIEADQVDQNITAGTITLIARADSNRVAVVMSKIPTEIFQDDGTILLGLYRGTTFTPLGAISLGQPSVLIHVRDVGQALWEPLYVWHAIAAVRNVRLTILRMPNPPVKA